MNKEPVFITKSNWLTLYAIQCGYIEINIEHLQYNLTLWHEGGSVYHVRLHDHLNHIRVFWQCFENLPAARKFFSATCKKYKLTRKLPK